MNDPIVSTKTGDPQAQDATWTLASVPAKDCDYVFFGAHDLLRNAVDYLNDEPNATGVMVSRSGRFVTALSRTGLTRQLAQAYYRELFSAKPISHLLQVWRNAPLILTADTTVADATRQALARPVAERYEPIVVVEADGTHRLVDVHTVLNEQCRVLTEALDQLRHQRRATLSAQREMHRAATHDNLTGLPNRAKLHDHLSQALARSTRDGSDVAVFFIDFDRFKIINDSLGHNAGDQVLVGIADRLRRSIGAFTAGRDDAEDVMAARLGGDEFVVVFEGSGARDAIDRLSTILLSNLRQSHVLDVHEVYCTGSIGIALSDKGYTRPEDMLRDADAAMYRAKLDGTDRAVIFDDSMHAQSLERLRLESMLRKAVDQGEFELHYQPIVSTQDGKVTGFEALLRWRHPVEGIIGPDKFIQIAEETNLILPIGDWVMNRAAKDLRRWQQDHEHASELFVAVNLSKRQLLQPGFVQKTRHVIDTYGLEPSKLTLEVTESFVMDAATLAVPILEELKRLGVTLALDDFGSGHSSLNCLHSFPADVLKIDRAFVANLDCNKNYAAVVQAIVTLANNLGMRVVAEGVEMLEQLVQMQTLDCDAVQGYLFAKPLSHAHATRLVAANRAFGRPDVLPIDTDDDDADAGDASAYRAKAG